jgi:phosphate transport system permease protein
VTSDRPGVSDEHSAEARISPPPNGSGKPKKSVSRPGDKIFSGLTTGSGIVIVAMIALIGAFLIAQAIPALSQDKVNFLTSDEWSTGDLGNLRFGIRDLLFVTIASSLFALVIAMPVALGIALFITQYAPRRVARACAYVVDLLAAVPSIIFGLWGALVLAPAIAPFAQAINDGLGWIPIFADGNVSIQLGGTVFTAGIVLAVMLLPIISSVTREVFDRTPTDQVEGALALGATKWEMIKTTVLPFGRAGYINASMLGLGRALGETVALLIILSSTSSSFHWSLFDGGATIASKIGSDASEFNDPTSAGAYIAAGLVLFVLTFAVNAIARGIVAGKKEYRS